VTVVGEGVAHVAQPAGVVAFAVQPCVGIGVRYVRVVAAAFVFSIETFYSLFTLPPYNSQAIQNTLLI
jgi:hypothetical protein